MRAPDIDPPLPPAEIAEGASTAVLGGRKGPSHRPLPVRFRRDGFDYRQIAREGDGAIYEQALNGRVFGYEVIRVRRREGFSIGEKWVEPAEIYPRSEAWGSDGWTVQDKEAAFQKLKQEMRSLTP